MATNKTTKDKIESLKKEYDALRTGKDGLLLIISEAEVPESVYNSNAIENSTLTLKETEKILLEMAFERNVDLKEVFEAKNLARVVEYVMKKSLETELSQETIRTLHAMLITNINDRIAGRFRTTGEYVRVGTHIAPAPEHVEELLHEALLDWSSDSNTYFVDKIARFHLQFEHTHPFNDGNGRVGRLIMNYQLQRLGFPPIIIRFKERNDYYAAFRAYNATQQSKLMETIIGLAISESLNKRVAYLRGDHIIPLTEYARNNKQSSSSLLNKAKRQTIPAFREKGKWKIGSQVVV